MLQACGKNHGNSTECGKLFITLSFTMYGENFIRYNCCGVNCSRLYYARLSSKIHKCACRKTTANLCCRI